MKFKILKPNLPNLVRIDGDLVRDMFDNDVDHTIEGRKINAHRISHLTKYLSDQKIHVIAAILSNFPEWQSWNRKHIKNYYEIYLKSSLSTLKKRDSKNLYKNASNGLIKNVVGIDIPFKEPINPDLIVENEFNNTKKEVFNKIKNQAFIKKFI